MTSYRTYDDWKLASPDDEPDYNAEPIGECDCCGKQRPLTRTWYLSMETWACEECTS